jgi:hypothetical protein
MGKIAELLDKHPTPMMISGVATYQVPREVVGSGPPRKACSCLGSAPGRKDGPSEGFSDDKDAMGAKSRRTEDPTGSGAEVERSSKRE